MNTFLTISEYISSFDGEKKALLQQVYKIIKKQAPKEATECINYKMPTFRYNGNLIHFALFKNHLGLYPGVDAIVHFKDDLKEFKTSKGAIQIPLNKPLPQKLIKEIVAYNSARQKEKKTPNWHAHKSKWVDAEEFMQQLIVKTNLEKTMKWGSEVYTFKGKNVIAWGGFKDFFSLWFYNGVFLTDTYKVLVSASEGKTKALRQWRFTDVKEMDEDKIRSYINESIQTIKDGKEIVKEKAVIKQPEALFKEWLEENGNIKEKFHTLTQGRQNEYIEYIEDAKQEKTKRSRLEKIAPLILEGKGLNDKYRSK